MRADHGKSSNMVVAHSTLPREANADVEVRRSRRVLPYSTMANTHYRRSTLAIIWKLKAHCRRAKVATLNSFTPPSFAHLVSPLAACTASAV
uniref:Uncharacterized protein n=1 Tax=Hyaloperonospora arabidopsidis (strain Emoy2) TaxID=559515 RepID=M4BE82_HYAAE